jgi:hypothetical protein
MSLIKTLTVDGFYTADEAARLSAVALGLQFEPTEFGREIRDFNMVPGDADQLFSHTINKSLRVIDERSGVFRIPELFIHFESFDSVGEWLFVVALENSTFNLFEHQSGAKTAVDGHLFNYRNLFEWDLTVNYLLKPGQGIFFRPWLFHSFDQGLIQTFRLEEISS